MNYIDNYLNFLDILCDPAAMPWSVRRYCLPFALCCLVLWIATCPLSAQVCYRFSDVPPGAPAGYVADVSIASIPPSQPVFPPEIYGATFTTYPSGVIGSPLNTVTIKVGQTTFTYNSFSLVIFYSPDLGTQISIQGSQFPPSAAAPGFSIQLTSQRGANLLPNGLVATLPPVGDFPISKVLVTAASPMTVFQSTVASITSTCAGAPISAAPALSAIQSAGGFGGFTAAAPGSWVEIFGTNLASGTRSWTPADFSGTNAPTSLDGTKVTIGGKAAFIDYISPSQVNALLPSDAPTGPQPLIVATPQGTSAAFTLNVNPAQPGLLAPSTFKIGAAQYAVAVLPDGSFALPAGAIAGVASRPAKPGETIVLYGVGFGPVTPAIPAGQLAQQANSLISSFQVSLGGIPIQPAYAGLAPSYTGLYQFNLVVPNIAPGNALLTFVLGGISGTQPLNIAVGN